MNLIRRELIKAYFEATRYEDEYGLDHSVDKKLIPLFQELVDRKIENVRITSGSYIQVENDWAPPAGIVFDGVSPDDGKLDMQVMVEVDKFGNVENMYWENV